MYIKSYNNIWSDFISDENIKLAIKDASRGGKKKKWRVVKRALHDIDATVKYMRHYAAHFENCEHEPKVIYDGVSRKQRIIITPKFKEQVVHHMLINVSKKMFLQGAYEQAYGSIPGRGVHAGKKVVEKWIKKDSKNCKYILKMDIKKYFHNISHDVLKKELSALFRDKRFLEVFIKVIDATDEGLPLGFYTSQWLAMWHLKKLDHFIKEQCYAPHYIRYMDDLVIFGRNKRKLAHTLEQVKEYLNNMLDGLELNNRTQLFRFVYEKNEKTYGRDLDFMGYRFFRNKTILRKKIMLKMTRKAIKISKKSKPTIYDSKQMMSYWGWIKTSNSHTLWSTYVEPRFDIKNARKRISTHDKIKKAEG